MAMARQVHVHHVSAATDKHKNTGDIGSSVSMWSVVRLYVKHQIQSVCMCQRVA
jgi:hypothetical protein